MIVNVHERLIQAPLTVASRLIDRLASRDDVLWPSNRWPAMHLDRSLQVGATGGHGPIRYFVEAYEPGRSITFRFTAPRGFVGTHSFDVEAIALDASRIKHTLTMRAQGFARLSWPLLFHPLHDALIEDALDCAEAFAISAPVAERAWALRVKLLRGLLRAAKQRSAKKAARRLSQT